MNKKNLLKRYLYFLYRENPYKPYIHLDGGAALTFFYGIQRDFSNDLDFTIESNEALISLYEKTLSPLAKSYNYDVLLTEKSNKIEIKDKENNTVFKIDYYIVPSRFCDYSHEILKYGSNKKISCKIHSIEDIYVEKLFCSKDRTEIRDLKDSVKIFELSKFNKDKIKDLYIKKNRIKKSKLKDIRDYSEWFEKEGKKKFLEKFSEVKEIEFLLNKHAGNLKTANL